MSSRRQLCLALLAAAASAGCRAAGFTGSNVRPEPIAVRPAREAQEVVAQVNATARRVQALQAKSAISLTTLADNRRYGVDGNLFLERPRSFRLLIDTPGFSRKVADLGSNDHQFWFWVKDNPDQAIYVSRYDEQTGASPLASALQPDWIVEAMGLREITEEEAARLTVHPQLGYTVLSLRRRGPNGENLLKETWVDSATGRVVQHRLIDVARDGKPTLLALAKVLESKSFSFPKTAGGSAEPPLTLPKTIELTWYQQKIRMKVDLSGVQINPSFDDRRDELFTVPQIAGMVQKDPVELSGFARNAPMSVRQTRPVPNRRGRVRLFNPEPIDGEAPSSPAPAAAPSASDPPPLSSALPPLPETVVGARIPTAPETGSSESSAPWRDAAGPGYVR